MDCESKYLNSSKPKPSVYIPSGATVEDMQRINDKLHEEVVLLVQSLEDQMAKAKETKRKQLQEKMYNEGLHEKDTGNLQVYSKYLRVLCGRLEPSTNEDSAVEK